MTAWCIRHGHTVALAVVMLVALVVRGYGLSQESLWWDEVASAMHLPAPAAYQASPYFEEWNQLVRREEPRGLLHFFANLRTLDPASMPLYFSVLYSFATVFGSEMIRLRLLSLLIGMVQIPLLYVFGKALFGRVAGLTAALCLALSPAHAYFSQEVRMYGVLSLVALLSYMTLHAAWHSTHRARWYAHGVAQACLPLAHPFGVLVPFAQGLFLVAWQWREWGRIARWIGLNAIAFIPAGIVLLFTRYWDAAGSPWLVAPTLRAALWDLVAADVVGRSLTIRANLSHWVSFAKGLTPDNIFWVHTLGMRLGYALVVLLVALAVLAVAVHGWKGLRARAGQMARRRAEWATAFLLWWLVPGITLFVASHLWRPCMTPRYFVHSSLALYLLAGAAVSMMPGRLLKGAAVAGLITLYGYQVSVFVPPPQRTDYLSAAAHLHEDAAPDEVILVHNWLWMRVFGYTLGPVPNVVSYGGFNHLYSDHPALFHELAELAAFATAQHRERQPEGQPGRAWLVVETSYFGRGPARFLEEKLERRGLVYEMAEFRGLSHVMVYRVELPAGAPAPLRFYEELGEHAFNEFADLGVAYHRHGRHEEALEAFEHAFANGANPVPYAMAYAGALAAEGREQDALVALTAAVFMRPEAYPEVVIAFADLAVRLGYAEAALNALQRIEARTHSRGVRRAEALTIRAKAYAALGDAEAAAEEVRKALRAVRDFAPALAVREALE